MSKVASMSSGAIDPIAQTKRVFWRPVTSTTVLKVGQPVCYNSDAVVDHKERTSDPTHLGLIDDTYAEGAQDFTGRLFIVEEPLTANLMSLAGFVKSLGPKAGADGDMIEIFVPNGAILPVRIDQSVTLDATVLGIRDGVADLSYPGRPIGVAKETIDRGTPGLCWVKIDPNMFVYQSGNANTGLTGYVANIMQNTYIATSGTVCGLMIHTTASGAVTTSQNAWSVLSYLAVSGGSTGTGYYRASLSQLVLSGTYNNGALYMYGAHVQVTGTPTLTHVQRVAGLSVEYATTIPTTGDNDVVFLYANPSGGDLDSFVHMFGDGEKAEVIWKFSGCGGLSTSVLIKKGGTGGMWTNTGTWMQIPIDIDGTTYYIPAGASLSEA